MQKQIFSEEDIIESRERYQAKQEFSEKDVLEEDLNAYQNLEENREVEGDLLKKISNLHVFASA